MNNAHDIVCWNPQFKKTNKNIPSTQIYKDNVQNSKDKIKKEGQWVQIVWGKK